MLGGMVTGSVAVSAHDVEGLTDFLVEPSSSLRGGGFACAGIKGGLGHTFREDCSGLQEDILGFQSVVECPALLDELGEAVHPFFGLVIV